ncbi:MAG: hypothetical protein QXX83_04775 [Thermofilum sp.]
MAGKVAGKGRVALLLLALFAASALVIALNPPPPPKPLQPPSGSSAQLQLTEQEKSEALSIALKDPNVGSVLRGVNWTLALAGPWTENGEKVGAVLLIRVSEAAWVSGTFRELGGSPYRASLWLGSLHVFVNLKEGKVAAASPGMARALRDPPVLDDRVEKARGVALAWVRGSRSAYLNGVFYTEEFPEGLAFFRVEGEQGESLVAVSMARMRVEERYSGRVAGG